MLEEGEAGPVTEQQMKMLEIVDRNARRLRGLIEDLLTLSRIEVGAFRLNLEPVEIGEVIASTLQTMAPTLRDKGLQLETEVSTDLGLIDADRNQIERALLNLLSNAAKFTPSGGSIRIRAVRFTSELHLSISDTGIGIPPDEHPPALDALLPRLERHRRTHAGNGPRPHDRPQHRRAPRR